MKNIDLSQYKNKRCALVLSGGVVKAAAWHLGVALALEELGFSFKNNNDAAGSEFDIKRSLEIDTYVGSSAGSMIGVFLACGFTPQEIINGVLGLKESRMERLSYKHMFHFNKKRIKPAKSELYHPLEEFPPFIKHALKPFMSFSGFFSTEGVRRYLIDNIRKR
jgi:predicted acylesterase/phospholipase RssA